MKRTLTALTVASILALAACSGDDSAKPTPKPTPSPTTTTVAPEPSPGATINDGPSTPTPTPTPTATPVPVGGLPDGPLLALSPASGSTVTSQAVLIRGTVESGSTTRVNGVEMDPDLSGDFFVAVAVGPGENVISVEVTGADGTYVRKELHVNGF